MSDGFTATADVSHALAGLEQLVGENREHLARSMAVAGGKVFRDEAKARAPVDSGRLQSAIYLAYKTDLSTRDNVIYTVTWNKGHGQMGGGAPHGHLIEFGHWQKYKAYKGKDGEWYSSKVPLPEPRWIAAHPFLRPAFEAARGRAYAAMIERGRERLPELLSGGYEPGSEPL